MDPVGASEKIVFSGSYHLTFRTRIGRIRSEMSEEMDLVWPPDLPAKHVENIQLSLEV